MITNNASNSPLKPQPGVKFSSNQAIGAQNSHGLNTKAPSAPLANDVFFKGNDSIKGDPVENPHLQKRLDAILNEGVPVDDVPLRGKSLLQDAAYLGDNKIVRTLLQKDAEVDQVDELRRTPLHWAARAGHEDVVRTLLKWGANPNRGDLFGTTPVQGARTLGQHHIIEILKDYGATD